jgi:hypothetical protein
MEEVTRFAEPPRAVVEDDISRRSRPVEQGEAPVLPPMLQNLDLTSRMMYISVPGRSPER